MKEKRYLLDHAITVNFEGEKRVPPGLDAETVKDKDLFYRTFLTDEEMKEKGTNDMFNREEIDKVIIKDWKLDYLTPDHYDDWVSVDFICDMHSWIGKQPDRLYGIPISKRLKEVLEGFNLYPNKFYNAKVLFQEKYLEYYVWQFFLDGFDKFIDFEHSTFCEWDEMEKIGKEILKFDNEEELTDAALDKEWWDWGFERAVMKPEFKDNDCFSMPYPYGTLISERLKNALESIEPELTGFKITPFPTEFEYL